MGSFLSKRKGGKGGHNKKAPKAGEVSDHDRAVLDLKAARDSLKRYQTKLKTESAKLQEQAKALVGAGKKDRALLLLKLKRYKEQEADKADQQLLNVYQMIQTIEWEKQQLDVFAALQKGKDTLEDIHKIMSIEAVEQLMADSAEAMEYEQEISKLLSGNLSPGLEDEVEKEFEAMQAQEEELLRQKKEQEDKAAAAAAAAAKPGEEPATGGEEDKQQQPAALELPEVPTHTPTPALLPEERPATEEASQAEAAEGRRVAPQPVLA